MCLTFLSKSWFFSAELSNALPRHGGGAAFTPNRCLVMSPQNKSHRMAFASQPRYLQDAIISSAAFHSSYFTILGGRRRRKKKKRKRKWVKALWALRRHNCLSHWIIATLARAASLRGSSFFFFFFSSFFSSYLSEVVWSRIKLAESIRRKTAGIHVEGQDSLAAEVGKYKEK